MKKLRPHFFATIGKIKLIGSIPFNSIHIKSCMDKEINITLPVEDEKKIFTNIQDEYIFVIKKFTRVQR